MNQQGSGEFLSPEARKEHSFFN